MVNDEVSRYIHEKRVLTPCKDDLYRHVILGLETTRKVA